jgi:hypothetical protein
MIGIISSFKLPTNPVYITGHIKKNPKTSISVRHLYVFVRGDNKVLEKTYTDSKGNFKMTFTPTNEKSFNFYCFSHGLDTLLIGSVTKFESDTPEITFYIPEL